MSLITQVQAPKLTPFTATHFMFANFLHADLAEREFFAYMSDSKLDALVDNVLSTVKEDFFFTDFCSEKGSECGYANEEMAIEFIKSLAYNMI